MSQESVNRILHHARLGDGVIDITHLQNIEKLPEYSHLSSDEKNALALIDSVSIRAFLSSAAFHRGNAAEANRTS